MADAMTTARANALRRIRGDRSLRAFIDLLVEHGLPSGELSRQRLSDVEKDVKNLPPDLWCGVVAALRAAGIPAGPLAPLLPEPVPVIEPVPLSDPELRRIQWSRLLEALPGNRWWQQPTTIIARVVGDRWISRYYELVERFGVDPEQLRRQTLARLTSTARWSTQPGDRVQVDGDESTRRVRIASGELFVFQVELYNAGSAPWRARMLYRLGAPVTSSLPFTPALIPVPDTDPGSACTVLVPGRAQWFPNLAMIGFVMVFADCVPSLPGTLRFFVDTRMDNEFDHTLSLPDGFGLAEDRNEQ